MLSLIPSKCLLGGAVAWSTLLLDTYACCTYMYMDTANITVRDDYTVSYLPPTKIHNICPPATGLKLLHLQLSTYIASYQIV